MQCRNCGAEIADKALICYRCGTATTEAKFKPAPLGRARRLSFTSVAGLLFLAILAAIAVYLDRAQAGAPVQYVIWVAIGVVVIVIALQAARQRR